MSRVTVGPITKKPGEAVYVGMDFQLYGLRSGVDEKLTGTPTATEVGTSDLDISGVAVNTVAFLNERGKTCPIGKGVQVLIGEGEDFTDYAVDVECDTDGTPTQTLGVTLLIEVRSSD